MEDVITVNHIEEIVSAYQTDEVITHNELNDVVQSCTSDIVLTSNFVEQVNTVNQVDTIVTAIHSDVGQRGLQGFSEFNSSVDYKAGEAAHSDGKLWKARVYVAASDTSPTEGDNWSEIPDFINLSSKHDLLSFDDTPTDGSANPVTSTGIRDAITSEGTKFATAAQGIKADDALPLSSYTASDVKVKYESNSDTNVFTDSEKTKLDGIDEGAGSNRTAAEIKVAYESNSDTNAFTDAEQTKLTGVQTGAQVNRTFVEVKSAYESNSDTNAFTDVDKAKLDDVSTNYYKWDGTEANLGTTDFLDGRYSRTDNTWDGTSEHLGSTTYLDNTYSKTDNKWDGTEGNLASTTYLDNRYSRTDNTWDGTAANLGSLFFLDGRYQEALTGGDGININGSVIESKGLQHTLTAGANITLTGNVISASITVPAGDRTFSDYKNSSVYVSDSSTIVGAVTTIVIKLQFGGVGNFIYRKITLDSSNDSVVDQIYSDEDLATLLSTKGA